MLDRLRVFVFSHNVSDQLGSLCKDQGLLSLCERAEKRVNVCNHQSPRIPSKRVSEEESELRISVGDVLDTFAALFFGEGVDDVAEGGEGLVDVVGLLEAVADSASGLGAFRAGEVDDVEVGVAFDGALGDLDVGGEDGVGAGGLVVHLGGGYVSVELAAADDLEDLGGVLAPLLGDVVDEEAAGGALADLELLLFGLEQVVELLVVDLQVLALHLDLVDEAVQLARSPQVLLLLLEPLHFVERLPHLYLAEQVFKTPRQQPPLLRVRAHAPHCWPLNRERLSCARLPVREDRPVVPFQARVHDRLRGKFEHFLLGDVRLCDSVVVKRLVSALQKQ